MKKKVLFTATVDSHILNFHTPYLKYFKDNGDENMITDLTNFILENREIKVKETIRRKIEKNIEQ